MKKNIYRDRTFLYLVINSTLVIIGYALAVVTHSASISFMFLLKNVMLLLSIYHLLSRRIAYFSLIFSKIQGIAILSILLVISSLLSSDPYKSLFKVLTFIVPMMYVALSILYLMLVYNIKEVINAMIDGLNWVYLIPIVSFFVTGGSLNDTNIYYISVENEVSAFVSNHYGWSATIFLVTGIDLIRNKSLFLWRKILITSLCPVAIYLVLISGNRTSWLCLAIAMALFIVRYKGLGVAVKILASLVPLLIVVYLMSDSKSAINTRIEKSKLQEKKGEARVQRVQRIVEYFNKNPSSYATGLGMFNSKKLSATIGWSGYHNSYFEVLFGAGIPIFLLFLTIFLIRPGWYYIVYFSEHYLFLPPFVIIPYFESNLTGGQFLFFPWFATVILLSYSKKVAGVKLKVAEILQKTEPI